MNQQELDNVRDDFEMFLQWREQQSTRAPAVRTAGKVNPITGHASTCVCPKCPGWYEARVSAEQSASPNRRGSVLLDQVIPVCLLLAMVTVCGLILIPVIVPLVAVSAMMIVAVAVVFVVAAIVIVWGLRVVRSGLPANRR